MDLGDIGSFVGKIAPWIATAIGGPAAGGAVKALTGALGIGADSKPDDIQNAIANATPDQLLALKKADEDFALQMQAAGFKVAEDLAATDAGDRANARSREIAVKDKTPMILAYSVTAGFFGVLLCMLFGIMPQQAHDALLIMIGALGTSWANVINYYYGSTTGSKQKDDTIKSLSTNVTT